jgi:hypothetical protein
MQDESDEDAEADEEKEALRLQREAAEGLRADDFDQVRLLALVCCVCARGWASRQRRP